MQIYGIRMFNFCRFGETGNSIVFDVSPENKARIQDEEDSFTMDVLYDQLLKDPISYVRDTKERGITDLIAICGVKGDDYDRSNGVGKSTAFEAICYAHYDRIVRRSVNTEKVEKAGTSVVTRFNGTYPEGLRQSYVEEIFEEKGKIYRIKRGRNFTESHKSHSPFVEFECINEDDVESHAGHRTVDTNDAIANVTPWDYDVFVNGAMFAQNDAGKFLMGTDKTRKEMLINLLGLEDVVMACLEKIRERKNKKGKENDNLQAQLDIINEGRALRELPADLELKIEKLKKEISESDVKVEKIDTEINSLSTSDVVKKVASIKEEGAKVKSDIASQKQQKMSQVKEWKSLYEEAVKNEKIKDKKAEDFVEKRKELQTKIVLKQKWVKEFDMASQEADLKKVEKAKGSKDKYVTQVADLREKKEKFVKQIATEQANAKRFENELTSLTAQLEIIEGDEFVCDKCKSIVSRAHIEKEAKSAKTFFDGGNLEAKHFTIEKDKVEEKLKEAERRLDIINDWLIKEEKIKANIKEYADAQAEIDEMNKQQGEEYTKIYGDLKNDLQATQKQVEDYKVKIDGISEEYDKNIATLTAQIDEIADRYKEAQKTAGDIEAKIDELKKQKESASTAKSSANSLIGSITKELEDIKVETKKVEEIAKTLVAGKAIYNRLLVLEDVYGLDGIQTRIVKKYLPLLNVYIKEFFDILTNGEMGVEIFINSRSKVDIRITGGSADSYEMLSGGEQVLTRLAVDIGLALLSFSRCAQKPEIICLDEIFGPLDNFNVKAVFKLLQNIRNRFSRVLLISHKPEINESIPHKIFIEKEDGDFGRSKFRSIT